MSENIQSISQGTFSIGATSAMNFQAGPGIKIDSPSAGTVRIGNDETVLWSGDAGSANFPIPLSEAATNFERIRIVWKWNSTVTHCALVSEHVPTDTEFCLHNAAAVGVTQYFTNSRFTYTTNYTKIEYSFGIQPNDSWNTPASQEKQIHFYKIVGINRISGGNE